MNLQFGKPIEFQYMNWKGDIGLRRAVPHSIEFASNEFHDRPQWLLRATCLDRNAERTFAMKDMWDVRPVSTAWDGIPMNPHLDGIHVLTVGTEGVIAMHWHAAQQVWTSGPHATPMTPAEVVERHRTYIGPCVPVGG